MNWKTILSIALGTIVGTVCLSVFTKYSNPLGYLGGYIVLIVFILAPVSTLIIDYKFNGTSTLNKRFLISSISTIGVVIYNNTIRLNITEIDIGAVFFTLGLGILISFVVSLVLKY